MDFALIMCAIRRATKTAPPSHYQDATWNKRPLAYAACPIYPSKKNGSVDVRLSLRPLGHPPPPLPPDACMITAWCVGMLPAPRRHEPSPRCLGAGWTRQEWEPSVVGYAKYESCGRMLHDGGLDSVCTILPQGYTMATKWGRMT